MRGTGSTARTSGPRRRRWFPGLERLRDQGAAAVPELLPDLAADIDAYRVVHRRPLEAAFAGCGSSRARRPRGRRHRRRRARRDRCLAARRGRDRSPSRSPTRSSRATAAGTPAPLDGHDTCLRDRRRRQRSRPLLDARIRLGRVRRWFQLNNMLGELDVIGSDERRRRSAAEHDGADARARRRRAAARPRQRRLGPARRGDPADDLPRRRRPPRWARRSTTRASTSRRPSSRWRAAGRRRRRSSCRRRVTGESLGGPEPLLRRRFGRRAPAGRNARRRRRSTARRSWGRRPVIVIRPAEPGDAQALVQLAGEVGGEEGAWLLTTAEWRTVAEERRYLRAVRTAPGRRRLRGRGRVAHRRPALARA